MSPYKERTFVETDPVGVMVIGHGLLKLLNPSVDPFLYTCGSVTEVSL
jgi:hypothetical protein